MTFQSEGDRNYYVGKPVVTNSDYYDRTHDNYKEQVKDFLAAPPAEPSNGALVFDFGISGLTYLKPPSAG